MVGAASSGEKRRETRRETRREMRRETRRAGDSCETKRQRATHGEHPGE
jgi:hypothetical protein